ncbi:MAG: hypothetical protein ABI622_00205 [Chloroflexota bacterium]
MPLHTLARLVQAAGLAGLVAAAAFALLGMPALAGIDTLIGRTDATLTTAAAAARSAADAFDGFDASLTEATRATDDAALLAARTAETARNLASAMSISVFGTQPFVGLAVEFGASAEDLDALAGTLSTMRGALDGNGDDLAALQVQLSLLADDIERLAAPSRMPPLVPVGIGLLILLAIQSGGLLAAGTALSRLDASAVAGEPGR